MVTLPTAALGYAEIPITTVKPSQYRKIDSNTLVRSLVHNYHLGRTELKNVYCQDLKRISNYFEVNHIGLFKDPILNNTVCIVQMSQKLAP